MTESEHDVKREKASVVVGDYMRCRVSLCSTGVVGRRGRGQAGWQNLSGVRPGIRQQALDVIGVSSEALYLSYSLVLFGQAAASTLRLRVLCIQNHSSLTVQGEHATSCGRSIKARGQS